MKKMLIYWKVPLLLCCLAVALEFFVFNFRHWESYLWRDEHVLMQEWLLEFVSENAMHIHQDTFDRIGSSEDFSQILAMSTCSSEFTDARTILLAVMKPYSPET